MGPREDQRYAAPPMLNGSTYTVPEPFGQRAKAVTNASVTEIALTGDIFLQPPDAGGNVAKGDYRGDVVVELEADGDDIAWVVGPAGGGAAGPTFKGSTGAPAFAAGNATAAAVLFNTRTVGRPPYRYTFTAGGVDHRHDSIYAISRAGAAVLRYRVISGIPGAR